MKILDKPQWIKSAGDWIYRLPFGKEMIIQDIAMSKFNDIDLGALILRELWKMEDESRKMELLAAGEYLRFVPLRETIQQAEVKYFDFLRAEGQVPIGFDMRLEEIAGAEQRQRLWWKTRGVT